MACAYHPSPTVVSRHCGLKRVCLHSGCIARVCARLAEQHFVAFIFVIIVMTSSASVPTNRGAGAIAPVVHSRLSPMRYDGVPVTEVEHAIDSDVSTDAVNVMVSDSGNGQGGDVSTRRSSIAISHSPITQSPFATSRMPEDPPARHLGTIQAPDLGSENDIMRMPMNKVAIIKSTAKKAKVHLRNMPLT